MGSDPLDPDDPLTEVTPLALTESEETTRDDDDSFPAGGLIAALAGGAVAAGLALTAAGRRFWARLLAFLAGSAFGLFILGFLRRDERPGPPIDLRVEDDGPTLNLWWSAPERGGRVERYIAEGLVEGGWRPITEFEGSRHHGEIPGSEADRVERWRLRAVNAAGQSEPSPEAEAPQVEGVTQIS